MLKLGKPIPVKILFEEAGEEHEVLLSLRPPDRAFLAGLRKASEEGDEGADAWLTAERVAEQVMEWQGISDEHGEPLEVSAWGLQQVRDLAPMVWAGIVDALFKTLAKKKEEARGN